MIPVYNSPRKRMLFDINIDVVAFVRSDFFFTSHAPSLNYPILQYLLDRTDESLEVWNFGPTVYIGCWLTFA